MRMSRFVALILSIGFFTFSLTSLIHASSVFDKQVDHSFDAMLSDVCIEASPRKKEFFKQLWSSDIYRYKSRYSQFSFQLKNTVCLTDAQQIHVEIYLQHSKDRIVLDKHLTKTLAHLISLEILDPDLFNLLMVFGGKMSILQKGPISESWKKVYRDKIIEAKRVANPRFPSYEEIKNIYEFKPELDDILYGNYKSTLRLFIFCRRNRDFPCLFTLKDMNNMPILGEDGRDLWSQPALAASYHGLPYNVINGQTPQGIHRIDSVMPEANRYRAFGKYRRVILNWVPNAGDEDSLTKKFLPQIAHGSDWWKQASVSRDVGRSELRIHGTGKINPDPESTYYPFRKTSGCISQREGSYPDVEYNDQRLILDQLMESLGLLPVFENETEIKGILYFIEIDDQNRPVKLEEVQRILDINQDEVIALK